MKSDDIDCTEVQSYLESTWVDRPHRGKLELGEALGDHVKSCPRCQAHGDDLRRLDASLARGFDVLAQWTASPTREQFDETLRRLRESPPESQALRRIRRPVRTLLWVTFYALTLLGASGLALVLAKALAAR